MTRCDHDAIECLNPYEIIRKYRCGSCGDVGMCSCDEEFARKFLPHQLKEGSDLRTRDRVAVTLGFVDRLCNECRGLKPESHPRSARHGATSKVRRYYWREIYMEVTRRLEGVEADGDSAKSTEANVSLRRKIEREVVAEITAEHARRPKYEYDTESEAEFLRVNAVEVLTLRAKQTQDDSPRARLDCDGEGVSVEEFAARHLRQQGYDVLFAESVPFHVLFGVYAWLLIQDPDDPLRQLVGFGNRTDVEAGRKPTGHVWTFLPEDFGASGYADRRRLEVEKHCRETLEGESDLGWLFDYWLEPSEPLRQYLWAHRTSDIARARNILRILPRSRILAIVAYLIDHYWGRYVGWPDLLAVRGDEYLFAEVKFSKDKLSGDQRRWIRDNRALLHLPFKLVKIHRAPEARS
jgi:hypothetical protein